MDLATITLEEEEVAQHAERYEGLHTRKARQVQTALRALEQGRTLVDLAQIINNACQVREHRCVEWGRNCLKDECSRYDVRGCFPKVGLAPVRMVGKRVYASRRIETVRYSARPFTSAFNSVTWGESFGVTARPRAGDIDDRQAVVPDMPADVEQWAQRGDLILWEEDNWEPVPPPRPRDPALLEPIGGNLYLVKAVWDLTPLEAPLLGG